MPLCLQAVEGDITVEQLSGAMTNMTYRCGLQARGREVQVRTHPAQGLRVACSWRQHACRSSCAACFQVPSITNDNLFPTSTAAAFPPLPHFVHTRHHQLLHTCTQTVLMRVHASANTLFDRAAEIDTFQAVSAAGLGPRLLLLFDNGRVEEFLMHHVSWP